MAEESGGDGWWGSWGTEFLSNVKAKSAETLSLVKHDLSEFVTTIHHDTSSTIADTATTVKDQLKVDEEEDDGSTTTAIKQGMSNWLGSLSSALKENISQMATVLDDEPSTSTAGQVLDRTQARRNEIQTDPATYCNDPDGHPAHYNEWCKNFDLEQHKGEISELLVNQPKIRALYTKLVPAAVHHTLFWHRYFYRIHQLDQEEKRRAALVERANKMQEDELGWDDEEEGWDTEEVAKDQLGITDKAQPTMDGDKAGSKVDAAVASGEPVGEPEGGSDQPEEKTTGPTTEGVVVESLPDSTQDIVDDISTIQISDDSHEITHDASPESTTAREDKPVLPKEHQALSASCEEMISDVNETSEKTDKEEALPPKPRLEQELEDASRTPIDEGKWSPEGDKMGAPENVVKRENSYNGSLDSSWSKISEEELKHHNENSSEHTTETSKPAPSPSPSGLSSSSVVLVPAAADDDDLAWDNDLDFDGDDVSGDVTPAGSTVPTGVLEVDDDDWENWE